MCLFSYLALFVELQIYANPAIFRFFALFCFCSANPHPRILILLFLIISFEPNYRYLRFFPFFFAFGFFGIWIMSNNVGAKKDLKLYPSHPLLSTFFFFFFDFNNFNLVPGVSLCYDFFSAEQVFLRLPTFIFSFHFFLLDHRKYVVFLLLTFLLILSGAIIRYHANKDAVRKRKDRNIRFPLRVWFPHCLFGVSLNPTGSTYLGILSSFPSKVFSC